MAGEEFKNPLFEAAIRFAKADMMVFPGAPGKKQSLKSAKYSNGVPWGKTKDLVEIKRDWMRWPDANVCVATGPESGFWVLEVDTPKGHDVDGFASLKKLTDEHGELPDTRQAISPSGSLHFYFRWPEIGNIVNSTSKLGPGIDVRGDGGMVLAPPSIKPGVGEYKWVNKNSILEAPDWLKAMVLERETTAVANGAPQANLALVAAALEVLPNDTRNWDRWNRIGMAVWAATSGHPDGMKSFDTWSQKNESYSAAAVRERWLEGYVTSPPTNIGAGTLFYEAEIAAPGWRQEYERLNGPKVLPILRLKPSALASDVTRTEELLLESDVRLYQRGGRLMRPVIEEVEAAHSQMTHVARLHELNAVYMKDFLNRHIDYQKWETAAKKWVSVKPPTEIGATLLERAGEWQFPTVAGIITTPTLRPDGTILETEGYDPATRLLLIAPVELPPIPEKPTRDDALKALALLEALLTEFPFADDVMPGVSRSVALSALITPVARGAFPVAPMHVAKAPVAASGKSYFFDLVAAIAIGQPMPVMSAGKNEEETEKRLGAALLSGQPMISIDNVNGELRSDALCQIIERPVVSIRVLGRSEMIRIEARGTSIFCNGNNIVMVGDLTRRALQLTLNPRTERPELRAFGADPRSRVLANRGAYIAACLTICRAYMVAGRPDKASEFGSFQQWSDTVRSALIWCGLPDPVQSVGSVRTEDPELTLLGGFLQSFAAVFGTGELHRKTLSQVLLASKGHEELDEIIHMIASYKGSPPDQKMLGNWARRRKERVVADLMLCCRANRRGGSFWWVEHIDGQTRAPQDFARETEDIPF